MKYKIAFFTENNFNGKVDRNHPNARTDVAWMISLDAVHYSLSQKIFWESIPEQKYDFGILIIPKNAIDYDIHKIKKCCRYVGIMQEGPNWLWQDWSLDRQVTYFNALQDVDFLLCHNKSDVRYYKGLLNNEKPVTTLPTLMVLDSIQEITPEASRTGVMIGGNMTSWYSGFDSLVVALELNCTVTAPSMGRKVAKEDEYFPFIKYIQYQTWNNWITELSKNKYAVHLMKTHAAGTFALNCAYLGIPCIGYAGLDTQEYCHPQLTVEMGNLELAKKLAKKLVDDKKFYEDCKYDAKLAFNDYSEDEFLHKMTMRFDNIIEFYN